MFTGSATLVKACRGECGNGGQSQGKTDHVLTYVFILFYLSVYVI